MKPPARFLCCRLTLLFVVAGATSLSLATAYAQKSDPVSPNEPKVTICHRPPGLNGSGFSITVGQSAVVAHLAHGDSLGGCPEEGSHVVCHRGTTLTVKDTALSQHLAHGDTLGACSDFAGGTLNIAPPAASTPSAATTAKPATVVAAPVVQEDVMICYKGKTVAIAPASLQTYLSIGATIGRCPDKIEVAAPSVGKETEGAPVQK